MAKTDTAATTAAQAPSHLENFEAELAAELAKLKPALREFFLRAEARLAFLEGKFRDKWQPPAPPSEGDAA